MFSCLRLRRRDYQCHQLNWVSMDQLESITICTTANRAVKTSCCLRNNLIDSSSFHRGHTDLYVLLTVTDSSIQPRGGVSQQDVPIVHAYTGVSCCSKRKGVTGYIRYWQSCVVMDVVVLVQRVDAHAAHKSIWWLASKQTQGWRIELYLSCVVQLSGGWLRLFWVIGSSHQVFPSGLKLWKKMCVVAILLEGQSFRLHEIPSKWAN